MNMTTITKIVGNNTWYFLGDETITPRKKAPLSTNLNFDRSKFNFGMNWCAFDMSGIEMNEVKTNYIVECKNKIYLMENLGVPKGILLKHDRRGRIYFGEKVTFSPDEEATLLCYNQIDFARKWELYGIKD